MGGHHRPPFRLETTYSPSSSPSGPLESARFKKCVSTSSEFVTRAVRHPHSPRVLQRVALSCWPTSLGEAAMEQDIKTTELIKRCIVIAPVFVGLVAYTLLIAVQPALL